MQKAVYSRLLAACKKLLADWGNRNLSEAVQGIAAAVTEIKNHETYR